MNVHLNRILQMQRVLDRKIENKHKLNSKNLLSRKRLALIVELAELSNEIRCFKFWSLRKMSSKSILLDEFVDCLHFAASIAIFYKIDKIKFTVKKNKKKLSNIELTKSLTVLISDVSQINSKGKIIKFIKKLFKLASNLGFTFNDILLAYYEKNKINIKRQNEGY